MSVILAECKLVLVVVGVLFVTLATAQWRQAIESPVYLPASDPYMFGRVCASACKSPADEASKPIADASLDPVEAEH